MNGIFYRTMAGCCALALAACAPQGDRATEAGSAEPQVTAESDAPAANSADTLSIALAPTALLVVMPEGRTRELAFGTPRATVMTALERVLGAPTEAGENAECPPGPLAFANWRGGLTTYFNGGNFSGWTLDGRSSDGTLTTMSGVGIGSTRTDFTAAFANPTFTEDSLGPEIAIDGLSALLDGSAPTARITTLMAGDNCAAR